MGAAKAGIKDVRGQSRLPIGKTFLYENIFFNTILHIHFSDFLFSNKIRLIKKMMRMGRY
jgi:hypothetical protein